VLEVLDTDMLVDRWIAWSRLGGIAYISPDGSEVRFRCLRFHSTTAKWELSKDYPIVQRPVTDEYHAFVHLEWSQTGMDLAVADIVGRISVFTFANTAINHSTAAPIVAIDQQSELDRAVGMFWLNPGRQVGRPCLLLCWVLRASKDDGLSSV
jgi:mediator of RNA polymerase II transcription subunit 16, fungi type